MGKKVNRGFFGYLFILIGIALAFCAVCIVIMIFMPGKEILGFSYFSAKSGKVEQTTANVYTAEGEPVLEGDKQKVVQINPNGKMLEIETLVINTDKYDVQVLQKPTNTKSVVESISVITNTKISGFAKGKAKQATITTKYVESSKTLIVDAYVPTGFIHFANQAKIRIEFPVEFEKDIDIKINTTSGNVVLGTSEYAENVVTTLSVDSLDITTTSGEISTADNFELKNVLRPSSFKTESGAINFKKPISSSKLTIQSNSRNVNFTDAVLALAEFSFTSDTSFATFSKLTAPTINFNVKGGKIYSNSIMGKVVFSEDSNNCDFKTDSLSGSLLVGTMNQEYSKIATKTEIAIGKLSSNLGGESSITTLGKVYIGELSTTATIRTASGDVRVDKINAKLNINAVSSNITLGKIQNEDGELVGKGIESKITVVCDEKATINAYFASVADGSKITTKGTINAYFDNVDYKIAATANEIKLNDAKVDSPLNLGSGTKNLTLNGGNINIKTK